jgi:hypothetical protein
MFSFCPSPHGDGRLSLRDGRLSLRERVFLRRTFAERKPTIKKRHVTRGLGRFDLQSTAGISVQRDSEPIDFTENE